MSLVFFQLTVFFCIVNLPEIFHYCLYILCEVGLWITTSECFYWLNKWLKFLYLICRVSQQNVNRKKSKKVVEKLHVLPFCDIFVYICTDIEFTLESSWISKRICVSSRGCLSAPFILTKLCATLSQDKTNFAPGMSRKSRSPGAFDSGPTGA